MLLELHVKDIALIQDITVSFGPGLNILTGETGAGKSVLIGSVLLALGGKAKNDLIRRGAESGYVELVFEVKDAEKKQRLLDLGFETEDDLLIISRKLSAQRSISRVNGETVTLGRLREAAELLMDLYGQNEHQTLLNPARHLQILDDYLGVRAAEPKAAVRKAYQAWQEAVRRMDAFQLDEQERLRELEFAAFEVNEIEAAAISPGEEEELAKTYRKMRHAKTVVEALGTAYEALEELPLPAAISAVEEALNYDEDVKPIYDELCDADSILEEARRGLQSYAEGLDLDEQRFQEVEERLDLIRSLEAKYGKTAEEIEAYRAARAARIEELSAYDANRQKAEADRALREKELQAACAALTKIRAAGAKELAEAIRAELLALNFKSVQMELRLTERAPSENGADAAEFYAALNPGETKKPLAEVASGGELSRVMLAVKTVLAETDKIPTLIFDEIDTGISGRTAQQVSEKLCLIAGTHQVICITHLPQIAAMADQHYVIQKREENGRNVTSIEPLSEAERLSELARLLGGVEITDAVRQNAAEMLRLADEKKQEARARLRRA